MCILRAMLGCLAPLCTVYSRAVGVVEQCAIMAVGWPMMALINRSHLPCQWCQPFPEVPSFRCGL